MLYPQSCYNELCYKEFEVQLFACCFYLQLHQTVWEYSETVLWYGILWQHDTSCVKLCVHPDTSTVQVSDLGSWWVICQGIWKCAQIVSFQSWKIYMLERQKSGWHPCLCNTKQVLYNIVPFFSPVFIPLSTSCPPMLLKLLISYFILLLTSRIIYILK